MNNKLVLVKEYACKDFNLVFEEQCYQDLQKVCGQRIDCITSWASINRFFSIKYRFSREMTRLLIKNLSRKYPISFNKFGVVRKK
jgi:hypothetical protein